MPCTRMSRKNDGQAKVVLPPVPQSGRVRPLAGLSGRPVALGSVLVAYLPVWRAGLIWDDDGHVTRPDLRSLQGLWRIWFEPGATQQYYPFLHSAFWLEHRLWGDSALGYHLANVGLHALASWLLYLILRRISLPGALFAAAAFALHPVCVESVAWVSEQKNTLSAVFYLASALAYLRFVALRRPAAYALALVLFCAALATKTVTATLPAALLVVFWWKRGRLSWKGDVLPLAPFFCMGAAAGLVTAWMEATYIGATGSAYDLSLAGRVLVAGRALWFYLGKLLWPADLIFIYPRWRVDDAAAWQYAFPLAAAVALARAVRRSPPLPRPLAAALLFAGTLFPALGFVNVFPFVCIPTWPTTSSTLRRRWRCPPWRRPSHRPLPAFPRPVGPRRQPPEPAPLPDSAGSRFSSAGPTPMRRRPKRMTTSIARESRCWMAYENLGGVLMRDNRVDKAEEQFRKALEINPSDTEAMNELGVATMQQGRVGEAMGLYRKALEISPNSAETHINLGVALLQEGLPEKAADHFQHAAQIEPGNAKAYKDLAVAYLQEHQWDDAVTQFQRAVEIEPDVAETRYGLGSALTRAGRAEEAMAQFRKVLQLDDEQAGAHVDLATGLMRDGRTDDAIAHLRRAIEINPSLAEAHNNLANALLAKRGDRRGHKSISRGPSA